MLGYGSNSLDISPAENLHISENDILFSVAGNVIWIFKKYNLYQCHLMMHL